MLTALVCGTLLAGFLAFAIPKNAGALAKWYGVAVAIAGFVLIELMNP